MGDGRCANDINDFVRGQDGCINREVCGRMNGTGDTESRFDAECSITKLGVRGTIIQNYNVIWVFNPAANKVLMCLRKKDPYKGLYNLVGGKIELGEEGLAAAYRELQEETGITEIELVHLMDFTYHLLDACTVEVYVGRLKHDVDLRGAEQQLAWLDISEDFFDMQRFAGEGNIGHIFEIIKQNSNSFC